ncbi:MAG: UDP-glucose/GDP-mannose dehydrogenase family protein [Actinobacteria bacterium]|nr:MAG: UDP-glucose/GDP-mannose dehydrogenase family protein [Actinomycetota bacterium]
MADPLSIAVIGSGVVGTATGAGFTAKGHRVVFCDVDPERVALLKSRGFDAVHASALVDVRASAYLISVPSPTVDERVDTSYVREAAVAVGRAIVSAKHRPVVVVRSTVPPGTTERIVIPALELASGRRAGRDFGVCMNPEFLRAATAERDFLEPRVIVIGALDEASAEALRRLYTPWGDVPVHVMSLRTAEATKYVANLFNATKISFFNEMHRALRALSAEPESAFEAVALGAEGMWNPRYGTRGGLPYGGICLPKDAVGFLGFARDHGLGHLLPMLRATIHVNDEIAGLVWAEAEPELARAEGRAH